MTSGTTFVVYRNRYGFLSKDGSWNDNIAASSQFHDWASANSARLKSLDADPDNGEFVSVLEWT